MAFTTARRVCALLGWVVVLAAPAVVTAPAEAQAGNPRARDLGLPIGGTAGPLDAITDVAGVEVGHTTLISGSGKLVVGGTPKLQQELARALRGVGDVLRLPSNVSPGETLDLDFDLVAPSRPGNYEVEIRVSQAVDGTRGVPSPSGFRFPVRVER